MGLKVAVYTNPQSIKVRYRCLWCVRFPIVLFLLLFTRGKNNFTLKRYKVEPHLERTTPPSHRGTSVWCYTFHFKNVFQHLIGVKSQKPANYFQSLHLHYWQII
jgi:hypothetical protein